MRRLSTEATRFWKFIAYLGTIGDWNGGKIRYESVTIYGAPGKSDNLSNKTYHEKLKIYPDQEAFGVWGCTNGGFSKTRFDAVGPNS